MPKVSHVKKLFEEIPLTQGTLFDVRLFPLFDDMTECAQVSTDVQFASGVSGISETGIPSIKLVKEEDIDLAPMPLFLAQPSLPSESSKGDTASAQGKARFFSRIRKAPHPYSPEFKARSSRGRGPKA